MAANCNEIDDLTYLTSYICLVSGRPFPLKGRFYANVFIHFEPTGHTLRHESRENDEDAEELYAKARQMREDASDSNDDLPLPSYILPGTPEEERWRQKNKRSVQAVSFFYSFFQFELYVS